MKIERLYHVTHVVKIFQWQNYHLIRFSIHSLEDQQLRYEGHGPAGFHISDFSNRL